MQLVFPLIGMFKQSSRTLSYEDDHLRYSQCAIGRGHIFLYPKSLHYTPNWFVISTAQYLAFFR